MLIGVVVEELLHGEVPGDADTAGGHVADVGVDDDALLHIGHGIDDIQVVSHELGQLGQQVVDGNFGGLGEHTLDILQELGYNDNEISALHEEGAI